MKLFTKINRLLMQMLIACMNVVNADQQYSQQMSEDTGSLLQSILFILKLTLNYEI